MHSNVKTLPKWGRVFWMTDGQTEIAAALDFGIRIVHLSCAGMQNLFYCQPPDLSDGLCNEQGWRIYGGHRLCLAPESEKSYWPDNMPVMFRKEERGVLLTQEEDPWLKVQKSLRLVFEPDGAIRLEHFFKNMSEHPIRAASWGINTLDGSGIAEVDFKAPGGAVYKPQRVLTLWQQTRLDDRRLTFSEDRVTARHLPIDGYCKLGMYSPGGHAVLENKNQRLEITFASEPVEEYPDNGCNFEMFLNRNIMELETLGILRTLECGQAASHIERWRLNPLKHDASILLRHR